MDIVYKKILYKHCKNLRLSINSTNINGVVVIPSIKVVMENNELKSINVNKILYQGVITSYNKPIVSKPISFLVLTGCNVNIKHLTAYSLSNFLRMYIYSNKKLNHYRLIKIKNVVWSDNLL